MKQTALYLFIVAFIAVGCSSSSGASDTSSELPTGEEIGEKVSKRTKEAEKNDTTGVIIASSEDGAEDKSQTSATTKDSTDEPDEAAIGKWIEIGPDGSMTDANGEVIETIPAPDETGKIIVRHGSDVDPEVVSSTLKKLREAGWGEVTVTLVADDAPDKEAPAPEASKDDAEEAKGAE